MAEYRLTLEEKLARCSYPELEPRFSQALREAVAFIVDLVPDVSAILACGSILRGDSGPSSDLDMYVLRREARRQRMQKWFNGVPAEIFINPPHQVHKYFESEKREWRNVTAHMVATGYVVLQLDDNLDELRELAQDTINSTPKTPEMVLTIARYMAACRYEDATDIVASRPEAALMIMNLAVHNMLHYAFKKAGRWLPRDKDLHIATQELDAELGAWTKQYYAGETGFEERFALAEKIADRTIQTHGFFTWEFPEEEV